MKSVHDTEALMRAEPYFNEPLIIISYQCLLQISQSRSDRCVTGDGLEILWVNVLSGIQPSQECNDMVV